MLPLSSMSPISLLSPFMVCGDGDRCVTLMSLGRLECRLLEEGWTGSGLSPKRRFLLSRDFLILDVTPLKEEAVVKKKYGAANRVSFAGLTEYDIYRNSLLEQLLMESRVLCRLDQPGDIGCATPSQSRFNDSSGGADHAVQIEWDRKIPRTCSSVVDWLRISSGSEAAGGIYHGPPGFHNADGLIGPLVPCSHLVWCCGLVVFLLVLLSLLGVVIPLRLFMVAEVGFLLRFCGSAITIFVVVTAFGCHDGSENGLTKTSLITHLRDRHCNGDAQDITKQSFTTNLAVFEEVVVTFKLMGLWLCGVCFKTHTLRSTCRHGSSNFIPPPDCDDGIVRFVLYDLTKPSVPSSSDPS
ncbi:hypothetical protein Tco_1464774 [Tanacetum coccineum]